MDEEELAAALDDYQLVFSDDWDVLELTDDGAEPVASWALSTIVDGALDIMETAQERDDMLELARHFESLAKRIRRTIEDSEKGGE